MIDDAIHLRLVSTISFLDNHLKCFLFEDILDAFSLSLHICRCKMIINDFLFYSVGDRNCLTLVVWLKKVRISPL